MFNLSKKLLSTKVKTDLFLIVIFNIILYFIFSDIDALEWLYAYSIQHEDYELDEFIVLFIALSFSFVIFSLRRLNSGESKLLINEITEMAIKDPLTNLYNRRYFNEALESEIKRAQRTNVFFSLIMIDLDYFKKINDTYGHNIGDKALCQVSEIFVGQCRETDIIARWGDEEFIVFCPKTNNDGAIELGNKIIQAVNDFLITHNFQPLHS